MGGVTTIEGTATAQLGAAFDYNFPRRSQPKADDFNKRWQDIDRRLSTMEAFSPAYTASIKAFLNDALVRIDEYLRPAYDAVRAVSQLGVLFSATSDTPVLVALGIKQFQIPDLMRDQFAPAHYLSIASAGDSRVAMTGVFNDYDREVGVLTVLVVTATGAGSTFNDWVITACPPPIIPVGIDGGFYDGSVPDNYRTTPFVVENLNSGSFTDGGTY